jgi:ankyrin repeat protein
MKALSRCREGQELGRVTMNARTFGEMGALHFAARDGEQAMVEFLLERGADVNEPAEEGWTPLHFAAAEGNSFVAEVLLENGARVDARDFQGRTPLDLAVVAEHSSVIEIIRRRHGGSRRRSGGQR